VTRLSRRQFLASTATAIVGAATAVKLSGHPAIAAEADLTLLRVESRVIEVNGKPTKVFGLLQPDGTSGILTKAGSRFRVRLENRNKEPTLIHWHGLLPPYGQDGVPDLPQPLLPSGQTYDYDFPLDTAGTHWMHAHTLQEQQLLAAPLIIADPAGNARDEQQVVVLFHDFSFKSPEELLARLRPAPEAGAMLGHGGMPGMSVMPGQNMSRGMAMPGHAMSGMAMDINDIDYDAYLANDRTLDDPEVFRVERGSLVRLRLINGATATAFWIDLGALDGEVIAVDGNPIEPVAGRRFPLGMGQRIDIRIPLPREEGAWPILALREGAAERTGFVLATKGGAVARVGSVGDGPTQPLDLALEAGLRATRPFAERPAERRETIVLGGDMTAYVWTLNGRAWGDHQPLSVRSGERVELTLSNRSIMGHPMHLHGHHFQVVAIDGQRLPGAVRDTVWVPPMRTVTIVFDADNPGKWAFHCHHLYHMAAGMMTTVAYET
jgi:FtsP/CotA-like multicopper oxidase with cupredoxin domain